MTHDRIQLILMAFYVALLFLAWREGQTGKAIYWLGAIVLSVGVFMQRG